MIPITKQFIAIVTASDNGARVDRWLTNQLPDYTRSSLVKLFDVGAVKMNQSPIAKSRFLKTGDKIEICFPEIQEQKIKPQELPLEIVFEDDDLIVVNKAKGIVTHPAPGHEDGTLVNTLLFRYGNNLSDLNGNSRPGILHRLDKDTSGLLVVAKNNFTHSKLAEQIKSHSFYREYHAVVYGLFKKASGIISLPIGRCEKDRKKMAVAQKSSKEAETRFLVLGYSDRFSFLKLQLTTGRTHQIRVHMSHIGHPVAGDSIYGPQKVISELKGQCLHAKKLGFIHPRTDKFVMFDSQLPEYFVAFWNKQPGAIFKV